jgi:hypothetical protein
MPIIDCHGQGKKNGVQKEAFQSIQSCHRQGIEETHTETHFDKSRKNRGTHTRQIVIDKTFSWTK